MNNFIEFFDDKCRVYPMHLEISYSKITDWVIRVWKAKCADDGGDLELILVQHHDVHFAFAKAQVKLKEWLTENNRGY